MAMIVEHARAGAFNRNPLLTTTHRVTCPQCRHIQRVVYIDFLERGRFEVRATANIEVHTSQGPISVLETQRFTPIVVSLVCERCRRRFDTTPVSVEYLLGGVARPTASGSLYA
jgi:hypothetical protein